MPQITIKSGTIGPDGQEEQISEFFCDSPDCPNIATHLLGCFGGLRLRVALCDKHVYEFGSKI